MFIFSIVYILFQSFFGILKYGATQFLVDSYLLKIDSLTNLLTVS